MTPQFVKYLARQKGSSLEATVAPKPSVLQPTEILIRVKAVAINPADYKMIDEGHRVANWPLVPGLDGAGVIEQVGDAVGNFVIGERVLAFFTPGDRSGSFQEYAVVEEKDAAGIPANWSLEEASTLGVCYLTGIMAIGIGLKAPLPFLEGGPTVGLQPSSVLILGGSSAVGAATIQLLRLAIPACRILATSSPRHHNRIKRYLGADAVMDRNSPSLLLDVKEATPGSQGVDAIIDVVGAGRAQQDVFAALNPSGANIYAQVWTGDEQIDAPDGVKSILFRGRDLPQLPGNQNIVHSLARLLEAEKYRLPLPVHHVGHGLNALERALELMRHGVSGEKLVVSI